MLEKGILVEIDSLDNEETGCFASNQYLAKFCQCSETKVSKAISKLIELGYLYVKSFDGRQRVLKSKLTQNANQPCKKDKADLQNSQDNNILNNKLNNNSNIIAEQIITYLNEKAGTHFKPVDSNIKFIKARLKDYSQEDLKAVIDKKVKEWKGTEMQQYLRPETLFNATKFESYINGLATARQTKQGFVHNDYTKEQIESLITNLDEVEV